MWKATPPPTTLPASREQELRELVEFAKQRADEARLRADAESRRADAESRRADEVIASKEQIIELLRKEQMRYLRELATVAGVLDLRRLFEHAMVEFGNGSRNYTDTYNKVVRGELIVEHPQYARKLTPWAKAKLVDSEGEARATKDEKNVADEIADIYRSLCNEVHFMVPSKTVGLRCTGKFPLRAACGICWHKRNITWMMSCCTARTLIIPVEV
jgi:hypothetical protein